jgi:hypothetical protein
MPSVEFNGSAAAKLMAALANFPAGVNLGAAFRAPLLPGLALRLLDFGFDGSRRT